MQLLSVAALIIFACWSITKFATFLKAKLFSIYAQFDQMLFENHSDGYVNFYDSLLSSRW